MNWRRAIATPWGPILGLVVVYTVSIASALWPWGLGFIAWAVIDGYRGKTWFVDNVDSTCHPGVFWLLIVNWFGVGVLLLGISIGWISLA